MDDYWDIIRDDYRDINGCGVVKMGVSWGTSLAGGKSQMNIYQHWDQKKIGILCNFWGILPQEKRLPRAAQQPLEQRLAAATSVHQLRAAGGAPGSWQDGKRRLGSFNSRQKWWLNGDWWYVDQVIRWFHGDFIVISFMRNKCDLMVISWDFCQ